MEEKLKKKLKSECRIVLFGLVILLGLILFIGMYSLVICLGLNKAPGTEKEYSLKMILAAAFILLCGSVIVLKVLLPVGKDYRLIQRREYRIIEATFMRYDFQKVGDRHSVMRTIPLFCDTVTREILTFDIEEELEQDVCYRIAYLPNTKIAVVENCGEGAGNS